MPTQEVDDSGGRTCTKTSTESGGVTCSGCAWICIGCWSSSSRCTEFSTNTAATMGGAASASLGRLRDVAHASEAEAAVLIMMVGKTRNLEVSQQQYRN